MCAEKAACGCVPWTGEVERQAGPKVFMKSHVEATSTPVPASASEPGAGVGSWLGCHLGC